MIKHPSKPWDIFSNYYPKFKTISRVRNVECKFIRIGCKYNVLFIIILGRVWNEYDTLCCVQNT